jgi:phenylalanyl-tRNA synthetase beta chain
MARLQDTRIHSSMKISLEWLSEYLPGPLLADDAAQALTGAGFPVEHIEQTGGDTVLDVEVTSNRSDCLCHIGVARELAAILKRPLVLPEVRAAESSTPAASVTSVRIEAPQLCPQYTARIIRNVRIAPSPDWMVRRLRAVGLRSINNVVDVTNYVMFEMGQPLHAFDLDRLGERRIVVREARPGEKIVSIDGHERVLSAGMLVIADAVRPVAVAGVMGGLDSEVAPATHNVLLESARFDPLSIRKTARALAMSSDSSYRFERQIDPTLPERASLRAAQLILETAGGELLGGVVCGGGSGHSPRRLSLRVARLARLLGISVEASQAVEALARLGLAPVLRGDVIDVTIPSWRLDLSIEADLIEEVARIIGYDRIPVREEISIRLTPPQPDAAIVNLIRSTLVASGHFEAITVTFVSEALARGFAPPEAGGLLRADALVRGDNAHLRPSILPGLLEAVRHNQSVGIPGARLFEIGSTFWLDPAAELRQRRRLGIIGGEDYHQLRGVVEALLVRLNADRGVSIVPDQRPGFAAGACGRIQWAGQDIGHLGRIDRAIAQRLALRQPPMAAEIDMEALLAGAQLVPQLHPLPRFPAVRRDLSLVVDEKLPYQRIDALVRSLGLEHLESMEYVTTYRGKPLESGLKSVTITLVFRSSCETLTSEQVEASVQKVVQAAAGELGATLRL